MHSHAALALAILTTSSLALAQRVQWFANGSVFGGKFGDVVRAGADLDRDGIPEVLVTAPGSSGVPGAVHVLSGRTGAPLTMIASPIANPVFDADATTIGDVDGDGVSDLAVGAGGLARVYLYSGSDFRLLRTILSQRDGFGTAVSAVGDVNGDGVADVAALGSNGLDVHSGASGALIGTFPDTNVSISTAVLQQISDLDGDGFREVLLTSGSAELRILDVAPTLATRSIPSPAGASSNFGLAGAAIADLDGDGTDEIAVADVSFETQGQRGAIFVFSLTQNRWVETIRALRIDENLTIAAMAGIGDIDFDGHDEIAVLRSSPTHIAIVSGRTKTVRSLWTPSSQFAPLSANRRGMTSLGDIDGDGFEELAIGSPFLGRNEGQCIVLSTAILASTTVVGTGCGEGPFLPQLGVSRPILGSTARIEVRDAPSSVPGMLIFSAAPLATTNLGVPGCEAAFDFAAWSSLANLAGATSYQIPLPIPLVPQFTGIDLALQAFFVPTNGPLGFDLSNGVWARVGGR